MAQVGDFALLKRSSAPIRKAFAFLADDGKAVAVEATWLASEASLWHRAGVGGHPGNFVPKLRWHKRLYRYEC
jgi:hypothetical protein